MTNSEKLEQWMKRYTEGLEAKPQLVQSAQQPTQPVQPIQPIQQNPLPSRTPTNINSIPFEKAYFLSGEFGNEFLAEYRYTVEHNYGNSLALKELYWHKGRDCAVGSNPFAVVLVNQMLRFRGIRTATQADLERIVREKSFNLKKHYEDTSLVWRSNEGMNDYLARDIFEQCKTKGINLVKGTPYVFPLAGMSLRVDSKSPQGLSFDLGSNIIYFEAPILSNRSGTYIDPKEMDDKTGLPTDVYPIPVAIAKRRELETINFGLSRLLLDENFCLLSNQDYLAKSFNNGQVVLVSAEKDVPKNLGGFSLSKSLYSILLGQ